MVKQEPGESSHEPKAAQGPSEGVSGTSSSAHSGPARAMKEEEEEEEMKEEEEGEDSDSSSNVEILLYPGDPG